jgi:hypothetical protein
MRSDLSPLVALAQSKSGQSFGDRNRILYVTAGDSRSGAPEFPQVTQKEFLDADGWELDLCVLCDVDSLDADLHPLLVKARESLRADGVLVLSSDSRTRSVDGLHWRDEVSTLLYQHGFFPIAYRDVESQRIIASQRTAAEPPSRRRQILSVIVPAYNEVSTFAPVMEALLALEIPGIDLEIIVVESNSTDGTREVVSSFEGTPRVRVLYEHTAAGKGHAVRLGLQSATGDIILIQDADLEYDFNDYERLVAPLRDFECSFVLGERMRSAGAVGGVRHFKHAARLSMLMNVGNTVFLALFNAVYRQRLRDPFTMFKVFRRDCIAGLKFEANRFDFDWELVAKLIRRGFVPREIPVSYHSRSFSDGKKITLLRDPLTWILACFKYRFQPVD